MLRISGSEIGGVQTWTLCGQLTGPWVDTLQKEWQWCRQQSPHLRVILDLSDVTFIDEAGEALLREMGRQGVEFVAKGIETRHILDNLAAREKPQLRRYLVPPGEGGCF
jgi:anti-anti-sigma regulatory factor